MDLIQVITPDPKDFYILHKDKEISIKEYKEIKIEFCERTSFREGKQETTKCPMITYKVLLGDGANEFIKRLFEDVDSSTRGTIKSRQAKIRVGENKYKFNVEIVAIPDYGRNLWTCEYTPVSTAEILLRLENTNISLFDKAEEAYEKYSRFDILDL